ncbi:cupin-like domain-containing protein [Taibaiella koreensis]|uniref:cupin-like domain-containing protein n=1 Tax=Taibaiella koreensis TaxID=1268548 RepID=UPI000E599A94|nr:cupin-like domain-containing protein [Taibaiella koreensis]
MQVQPIDRVKEISPADFRERYLIPARPVIIETLSHQWAAYEKWTWDYFKSLAGAVDVPVYNNSRAGAKVLVNGGDDTMAFGDYIDMIRQGPSEWRIFLFNLFKHAPQLKEDFRFPGHLLKGFLRSFPMLFVGGAGSIAHMHYDIDLAHIFHTQFIGRKRILLLDNEQSSLIYRMPGTVESAASFVNWQEGLDTEQFPALALARGYTAVLEHGDTLFMPSGYWHHMEYLESGCAMSLRAMPETIAGKLNGLYHLVGLRNFNNMMIRLRPQWWYQYKRRSAKVTAERTVERLKRRN